MLSIHLGTGDSLRLLQLNFNQLESIDVRGLTNLIEFAAPHNKIGNVGCQSLLELVKNGSLPSLDFLDLSNNTNISSELKDKFRRVWREKGKGTYHLRFTPYPPQHQKSRTDPGNHNITLAAIRIQTTK